MTLVCKSGRPKSTTPGSSTSPPKASFGCLDAEGKDDIVFTVFDRFRDRIRLLTQRETEAVEQFDTGLKNQLSTLSTAELNIRVSEFKSIP
jgi:hypothetical protein